MITFPPPCNMASAMVYSTWQDHKNRPGYTGEPGVDLASYGQVNVDLFAVLNGVVTRAEDIGWNSGYGSYVEIDHGVQSDGHRYKTLCAHMYSVSVNVGQRVSFGQKIGVMGTTGNSEGVHTHFILWVDGKNVDPQPYFGEVEMAKPTIPPVTENLRVKVICASLNVRTGPGKLNKYVDNFLSGAVAQVYEIKNLTNEVWVKISPNEQRWICLWLSGLELATFFTVVAKPNDVVARLEAVVADAKETGRLSVSISTGDLQDLLQLYKDRK